MNKLPDKFSAILSSPNDNELKRDENRSTQQNLLNFRRVLEAGIEQINIANLEQKVEELARRMQEVNHQSNNSPNPGIILYRHDSFAHSYRASSAADPYPSAVAESFNMSQQSNSDGAELVLENQKTLDKLGVQERPEEYICNLTNQVMDNPVRLKAHEVTLDQKAWDRCSKNPYTNNDKQDSDITPDDILKAEIDAFVKTKITEALAKQKDHKEERDEKAVSSPSNVFRPQFFIEASDMIAEQNPEGHGGEQHAGHQQRRSEGEALRAYSFIASPNVGEAEQHIPAPQPEEQSRQADESSNNGTSTSRCVIL